MTAQQYLNGEKSIDTERYRGGFPLFIERMLAKLPARKGQVEQVRWPFLALVALTAFAAFAGAAFLYDAQNVSPGELLMWQEDIMEQKDNCGGSGTCSDGWCCTERCYEVNLGNDVILENFEVWIGGTEEKPEYLTVTVWDTEPDVLWITSLSASNDTYAGYGLGGLFLPTVFSEIGCGELSARIYEANLTGGGARTRDLLDANWTEETDTCAADAACLALEVVS